MGPGQKGIPVETINGVFLPVAIFLAQLLVVTFSTIRIIFIARGKKVLASCFGFLEVSIWLTAVGQIMKNLDSPACFIGYATGYALGNYMGLWLEQVFEKLVEQKP